MTFPAQSPDLRRFPLVAGASRSVVRSPRSAAPRIRFLFVDSRVRFTLRSAYASRRTPCASLRSLRPGSGRTFTSKSSPMPGPPQSRRARPFGRALPVHCELKARGGLKVKVRARSYRSATPVDSSSPTLLSFTAIARIIGTSLPPIPGLVAIFSIVPGSVTEYVHVRLRALSSAPPTRPLVPLASEPTLQETPFMSVTQKSTLSNGLLKVPDAVGLALTSIFTEVSASSSSHSAMPQTRVHAYDRRPGNSSVKPSSALVAGKPSSASGASSTVNVAGMLVYWPVSGHGRPLWPR